MTPKPRPFLTSLESLRGLAALAVALFHSFHLLPVNGGKVFDLRLWEVRGVDQTVLRLLMVPFNGGAAVTLFFVLSGFVLYLSARREHPLTIPETKSFVLRRLLRIYPPLALNLLAFILLWAALAGLAPGLKFTPFTWHQILESFTLHDALINGVAWTLTVEVLAVPCILVVLKVDERWGTKGIIGCVVAFFIVTVTPLNFKFEFVKSYYIFALGMLAANLYRKGIKLGPDRATWIVPTSLIALLLARSILGHWSRWSVLVEALSATILIAALVMGHGPRIHAALNKPVQRYLGRISYSFYLYQPLTLGIASQILMTQAPAWALANPILASCLLAAASVAAAIPLSAASHQWIEIPSIRLGRRV